MKLRHTVLFSVILTACSGGKEDVIWWDNEKQIIELNSKINLARYRAEMLSPQVNAVRERRNTSLLLAELKILSNVRAELSMGIAEMQNGWDGFREAILDRRRAAATGISFDTLMTANGREYKDVTVSRIDDGGVSLRHISGTARLRYEDLDSSRQEFFGLDGELSTLAHEAEAAKRKTYDRWIAEGMEVVKKEEARLTEIRREDEKSRTEARALAASRRINTPSTLSASFGRLGETRTIYSSRRYSYYGYYRRSQSRYCYPYYSSHSGSPAWNCTTIPYRQTTVIPLDPVEYTTNPFKP